MDTTNEPVKTAMTDAECEAIISAYILAKLAPIFERIENYCTLGVTVTKHRKGEPARIDWNAYTAGAGHNPASTAAEAVRRCRVALGDVLLAAKLREEAAQKIAAAEQIEAAAAEGEVAK